MKIERIKKDKRKKKEEQITESHTNSLPTPTQEKN